jgi:hypothetical protein
MTTPRQDTAVSPENRAIARHAAAAFSGRPSVRKFLHDTQPLSVDILTCADSPTSSFNSYSTIGLSDHPMLSAQGEFPTRIEIAGVMEAAAANYHQVLGSAAFRVMRTQEVVRPGAVFDGYVAEYFPDTELPHLYFTAPFYWSEALNSAVFGSKRVSWLLAVPISEAEAQYVREHGDDAFERMLESADADVTSLGRPSVV